MKVLMLGWEYPPHISGGLGTACEGLTTALARIGLDIDFVVPRLFGGEEAEHMTLLDSNEIPTYVRKVLGGSQEISYASADEPEQPTRSKIRTLPIPSLLSPYFSSEGFKDFVTYYKQLSERGLFLSPGELSSLDREELLEYVSAPVPGASRTSPQERYGTDIFSEVNRFTANAVKLAAMQDFDVIHAHDWMTYPAGVALSQVSGKPLVCHVHSLEFDRSGSNVNERINEIERMGLQAASAIVAVSYYTMSVINRHHGIPVEKISVVHNGVYSKEVIQSYRRSQGWPKNVVLFLGRITFQKGPDYFIEAAARVIPHVEDVLFVMAGSGDMLPRMINRVGELGIGQYFYFPGFLKGEDVERMFSVADLYVMPSVSEPFGISALEAISFDTPVIISRQSGVSEVLSHALKVDFWDIDRLADLMINSLVHSELRADMVGMAREEVRRLHWDAAALKTLEIYRHLS